MTLAPAFFRGRGQIAFGHMQKFDAGIVGINAAARNQIIDNVFRLIRDHARGDFYANFFDDITAILGAIQNPQGTAHRLRLSNIFLSKLSAAYVNRNSLGGWSGGASEILDTVRSLARQGAAPTRAAVPSGDKAFVVTDYQHPMGTAPKAFVQDIDRTEVHGTTKYYVEVKADADTAVHKIGNCGVNQLEGILAVIRSRQRRRIAGATDHFNRHNRTLCPAIALTNPVGWLVLFTKGTIKLYYLRGFHLMIDGLIISPANLALLYQNLWTLLGLNGQPMSPYELNGNQAQKNVLHQFWLQQVASFPSPSALDAQNYALAGFNLVPQQNAIIPPAPPMP